MTAQATAPTARTMQTKKGKSVVTDLSDSQAIELIKNGTSKFARDLYSKRNNLSYDQWVWVHVLALEARDGKPEPKATNLGDLARIVALFASAQQHLKRPKIHLVTPMTSEGNFEIALYIAGSKSKYTGDIQVTSTRHYGDSVYYGRIEKATGNFIQAQACPPAVVEHLKRFAANPEGVAREFGLLTGDCCFCNRALTDERSTSKGYGPKCAENYNLPW